MDQDRITAPPPGPLKSLDEWDDFVKARYAEVPQAGKPFVTVNPKKKKEEFRNYKAEARPSVKEFYRQNHTYQTREFVLQKKREYVSKRKTSMGIWEAMQYLNTLVDNSDPDTNLSQIEHLLQTSEAARRDGRPQWFILASLLHDL